jgi:HPt (histidine-containing phosphotransfer) domain-containing protein
MMLPTMTYPSRVNPGTPAIDPESIEQLRFLEDEDQPNVVAELVLLFVEHTPPKIAAIKDGVAQGDAGAVKRAAHSLKGSSANVGAFGMQQVCEKIEHAAANGDLAPARELLPLLESEVSVVVEALQAEL